jgi:hypothetical protein
MRCGKRSRRCGRGLTLVEALAGTAILGSMLVAILVGSARFQTLGARAERRIEACRVADRLLEHWWPHREKVPRNGMGEVPGCNGWTWRTRTAQNEDAGDLGAETVVVDVFAPNAGRDDPAVQVEILLPDEKNGKDKSGPDAR